MSISATLQDCLRSKGSQYEIVHHPYSHSSVETAAAAHIPGDRLAKTVLFEDEHGYVATVLPSTYAVRLSELWAKTGRHLVLAKETDLRELFKDCDAVITRPTDYNKISPSLLEDASQNVLIFTASSICLRASTATAESEGTAASRRRQ